LKSVLSVLVIMPVLTVAVVKILDLRTATEAALVALAISPVPPLLPLKETKAGGQASYALGLLIELVQHCVDRWHQPVGADLLQYHLNLVGLLPGLGDQPRLAEIDKHLLSPGRDQRSAGCD
jgi:hypothetical protein